MGTRFFPANLTPKIRCILCASARNTRQSTVSLNFVFLFALRWLPYLLNFSTLILGKGYFTEFSGRDILQSECFGLICSYCLKWQILNLTPTHFKKKKKKILTYLPTKKKKILTYLPTKKKILTYMYLPTISVGSCKQTILKDGPISQAHSLILPLNHSLTLSIE